MLIQNKEPICNERCSNNRKSFAWSAFPSLSAPFFLICNAFVTLVKHNFTNFSMYSDTYINGRQTCILSFFRFLFDVKPQLIIQYCKICFSQKIKDTLFFQTLKSMRQLLFWIELAIYNPSIWIEFAFTSWKK